MTTTNTTSFPCHGGPGSHPNCKIAAREGRRVHVIPGHTEGEPRLILPNYHFHTLDEAQAAIREAELFAPMVETDLDLAIFRQQKIAHKLPVGWIDPSRR